MAITLPPSTAPNALLTPSQMSRADALAIARGTSGITLMESAGRAVAEVCVARYPKSRVCVLCGPGNNGGDGFIAARWLREWGWTVTVYLLGDVSALKGDAAEAARLWGAPVVPLGEHAADSTDLIIDAMFGAGLSRDISGVTADLINRINAIPHHERPPVIAVDVPSGVAGDTGAARGVAMVADFTVTFFRKKPAHLLLPARLLCGEVILCDIGIPDDVLHDIVPDIFENDPALWSRLLPRPNVETHKYVRGHALVVSGGPASTGAARLAARGAARAGAGLVTVASPPNAVLVNAGHLTSIMLAPCANADALSKLLEDKRKNVCVIGPGNGVGQGTRENVLAALLSGAAIVLDADALTSFAENPRDLFVAITGYFAGPAVLTPHEGEFKRLFPNLSGDRLSRARAAAREAGAVIVLKGPDTIIASPEGEAIINANAGPELATAGSGDVLSGIIAGLIAQGIAPFEAAAMGVWLHGAAGARLGHGLIAEDLPEALPAVWAELLGRPA
ncbi:MAG: NAD(P)H-hydrate dehydratase [Parvibaculaceae bacterium]